MELEMLIGGILSCLSALFFVLGVNFIFESKTLGLVFLTLMALFVIPVWTMCCWYKPFINRNRTRNEVPRNNVPVLEGIRSRELFIAMEAMDE